MKASKALKVEFTQGNKKLPASTYILNMGSATDCPSMKLGLCEVGDKCYALKAEIQYPAVKPFRERQRIVFDTVSARDIANELLATSKRATTRKMKEFRFSEAGDFNSQKDVDKMARICLILEKAGIKTYGYTARTDLDLTILVQITKVNVSNDLNKWIDNGANRFKAVEDSTVGNNPCFGDCRKCSLCFTLKGAEILVDLH